MSTNSNLSIKIIDLIEEHEDFILLKEQNEKLKDLEKHINCDSSLYNEDLESQYYECLTGLYDKFLTSLLTDGFE